MAKIVHIVTFSFKSEVTPDKAKDVRMIAVLSAERLEPLTALKICKRLLALKEGCVHPESKEPYIKSASGGKDNSPEGAQGGLTHVFILEFETEADRKYYLESDPVHLEVAESLRNAVEQIRVVDFTPGEF